MQGLVYDPKDPFRLGFIIRPGDKNRSKAELRDESMKMIRYFLASLTVPRHEVWVNLSPYEKNRIIPEHLAVTRLGGDMLAQDYVLKQLTSSLMFPDGEVGKDFWRKVYREVQKRFGRTDIPLDTFNKVWIVPDNAEVFVHGQTVIVIKSRLKVMMEEDYLAQQSSGTMPSTSDEQMNRLSSQIFKETVLPVLEKEINEGTAFASLRQIFKAAILAEWYKRHLKQSLVSQYYANQNKVAGIDEVEEAVKDHIYQQYVTAYTKGVFNLIREDEVPGEAELVPHKYFSGGMNMDIVSLQEKDQPAELSLDDRAQLPASGDQLFNVGFVPVEASRTVSQAPPAIQDFIDQTDNPFLANMKARVGAQAKFLENFDPNLIAQLTNGPLRGRELGGWDALEVGRLGIKNAYFVRIANSEVLGAPKGGIRYITADDLMHSGSPFAKRWEEFLALNPNEEQARNFVAKWIGQEAEALALGMSLKTAGLDIGLGGAKGAVFMGDVGRDANGQLQLANWDDKAHSQEPDFAYYVARRHSRQMAKAGVVGITIDSPAPDIGTVGDILETYNDEYLRYLTEQGVESFVWQGERHDELYERLHSILVRVDDLYNQTKTVFGSGGCFWQEKNGDPNKPYPMPWIGVFTGKRYERGAAHAGEPQDARVKMGGLNGRNEATGEGVVMVLKYFLEKTLGASHPQKSVAVQAFGNVGRYTALAVAGEEEAFRLRVINDFGITLIKARGWSSEDLKGMINILSSGDKDAPKSLYDLWDRGFIESSGVEAVIVEKRLMKPESPLNREDQDEKVRQLQAVFDAVMGADVEVLIPAFMEGQITSENQDIIKAHWIAEGANGPTTPAAEKALLAKGKIVIPDTLANSGGVMASGLEMKQAVAGHLMERDEVFRQMREALQRAVDNTLEQQTEGISLREAFDRVALLNLARGPASSSQALSGSLTSSTKGGIDLNTEQLSIQETGDASEILWLTPILDPGGWSHIQGMEPVFLNMQPLNGSWISALENSQVAPEKLSLAEQGQASL